MFTERGSVVSVVVDLIGSDDDAAAMIDAELVLDVAIVAINDDITRTSF